MTRTRTTRHEFRSHAKSAFHFTCANHPSNSAPAARKPFDAAPLALGAVLAILTTVLVYLYNYIA